MSFQTVSNTLVPSMDPPPGPEENCHLSQLGCKYFLTTISKAASKFLFSCPYIPIIRTSVMQNTGWFMLQRYKPSLTEFMKHMEQEFKEYLLISAASCRN